MIDTVEKTASSLAIVEKKPQRPGGCVGIFFQLFDWNRRFAKKKLFSKKLLPPGNFFLRNSSNMCVCVCVFLFFYFFWNIKLNDFCNWFVAFLILVH